MKRKGVHCQPKLESALTVPINKCDRESLIFIEIATTRVVSERS